MGITHVTAQVFDLARTSTPFEAEFLVDTGSLHCMAPASGLRQAGVTPEGKQVYQLARPNGRVCSLLRKLLPPTSLRCGWHQEAAPSPRRRLLANGEPVEYHYGFARIAFLGDETVTHVIFGPESAEPILGVVALENTGVMVDPTSQTLKRLPAMPLK